MNLHNLKNDFIRPLLLNEFDLSDHRIDECFINNLLKSPIDDVILNVNGKNTNINLYLGFDYITMEYDKKTSFKKFYMELNNKIKSIISDEWLSVNKSNENIDGMVLYKFNEIYTSNNHKEFIYFYLTPKKSVKTFDYSKYLYGDFYSKTSDAIISNIINILLRYELLDNIEYSNINDVVFAGDIGLQAVEDSKGRISAYLCETAYKNGRLIFNLKKQLYQKKTKDSDYVYDFIFLNSNTRALYQQEDARTCQRPFLNFSTFSKMHDSKFICQIRVYKTIYQLLEKIRLIPKEVSFTPNLMLEGFFQKEIDFTEITVCNSSNLSDIDFTKFANELKNKVDSIKNEKDKSNLRISFNEQTPKFNSIKEIINENNKNYLFIVKSNDGRFVYNNFLKEYSNVGTIHLFMKYKMYSLDFEQFIDSIKNYDIYSQVKLYNLFANYNPKLNLKNIVSQGLDIINFTNEDKKDKSILNKVQNELIAKKELYINNRIKIPDLTKLNPSINIDDVKIIKEFKQKRNKSLFSLLHLQKNCDYFNIIDRRIIDDESITEHTLINFKDNPHETQIILNNEYILKIHSANPKPNIIIDQTVYKNNDLDPIIYVNRRLAGEQLTKNVVVSKNTGLPSDGVTRNADPENIMFWPFVYLKNSSLTTSKVGSNGYNKSLISTDGNKLTYLSTLNNSSADRIIAKSNLLRVVELFHYNSIEENSINWEANLDILYAYFSTQYVDFLNINRGTKTTYFEKLANIILFN